jgi:stage III sporulation protein AB
MLKLMGSVCILAAGVAVHMLQVRTFRRELSVLRGLVAALEEMENEIRLSRLPLPRLLKKAGFDRGRDVTAFFESICGAIGAGELPASAWRSAAAALPIARREQSELAELGRKLCGDEEQACKGIELARVRLAKALNEKSSRQADWEKRSTALCFSGAVLLIILLI